MKKTIVAKNIKVIRLFGGKRYQLMTEVLNVGKGGKNGQKNGQKTNANADIALGLSLLTEDMPYI